MFEIEKNVPMPPARVRNGVAQDIRQILPTLKVGDSFLVPAALMKRDSVRVYCFKWVKDNPTPAKKFTARAVEGGTRVWRTS